MKKFLIVFIPIVIIGKLFFDFCIGIERKHPYLPYIDTEFAAGFAIDNWKFVHIGMNKNEVENYLGKPILTSYKITSSKRPKHCFYEAWYSHDGAWEIADFAWQSFTVYYDSTMHVMAKDSTWWYD